MKSWAEGPCLCDEGIARGICCGTAESMGFCGGCGKSRLCHVDELAPLYWYRGAIRLNWLFRQFDVVAYSREQAEMLVKKKVGFDKRFGADDFVIECIRQLRPLETATHSCECRIWENRKERKLLCIN